MLSNNINSVRITSQVYRYATMNPLILRLILNEANFHRIMTDKSLPLLTLAPTI